MSQRPQSCGADDGTRELRDVTQVLRPGGRDPHDEPRRLAPEHPRIALSGQILGE